MDLEKADESQINLATSSGPPKKQESSRETSQFSSVQSLSCVQLFVTPWAAAFQASLSNTNSQSLLKLMSIESVMPSNHLILCCPLLLPPSIFPSISVFSDESASDLILCCPLLLPPSIFPSISVFSDESHQVAKVLEFQIQHQSIQ